MASRNSAMVKTTIKVKKGKKMAKMMHVRKADGGYHSLTEFEQPTPGPNMYDMPERVPDHEAVHGNMADLQSHMEDMFGEKGDDEEAEGA